MVKLSRHFSQLLCTAALMVLASAAGAQSAASYPNKPVRIIVPFPAGGVSDGVARTLADRFGKDFGQPFIVDNRGGGETIIGTHAVAKANPDGYTLLVTTDSFLANHWLHPDLPYDALKDFTLISPTTRSETMLTVHPSVAANTLKDFIAYAKANPGKLNVGVTSLVGVVNFHRFMNASGTKFTLVPYKGGAPAMTDLVAGNVQTSLFSVVNVQSFIKAGRLKGLAVSGAKRDPGLPDVPTFAESGIKDFDPSGPLQFPLLAPIKTPRDIVEKLNAAARKTLADPEVISSLDKRSLTPVPVALPQAENLLRTELQRYGKIVKDSGLKPGDY